MLSFLKTCYQKTSGFKLPLLGMIALFFALQQVTGKTPDPVVKVENAPISHYEMQISGIGITEPKSEMILIASEKSGVLQDVFVQVGQKVAKGDKLFSLNSQEIDAKIQEQKANIALIQAELDKAQVRFNLVKNIADTRAISKDDYQERFYTVSIAKARLEGAKAGLDSLNVMRKRLTTYAPQAGTILEINMRLGEFIASQNGFIRFGDISDVYVRTEIDEEQIDKITPESKAFGYYRGNNQVKIPLQFVRFEPYVRPKQNLAVSGQRVDTRVVQVLYRIDLSQGEKQNLIGRQIDVFIEGE